MIASWNKFCPTGGLVEISVTLPGYLNVADLRPAVWALGNLGMLFLCLSPDEVHDLCAGRAGYRAILEDLV